jgi:hypothetical protein
MGKTGYNKCIEVMKMIKQRGYEKEVSAKIIRMCLMEKIGMDERTIEKYFGALQTSGFIKRIGIEGSFEIVNKQETITRDLY